MSLPDPVIHVIDDDEPCRLLLSLLLTVAGFRVQTYEGTAAFLATTSALASGCIITDLRMPQMSGLELMVHLQASGITLPVIMITAHGDVTMAVEAMKQGAADFLEKPLDEASLIAAVHKAIDAAAKEPDRDAGRRSAQEAVLTLSAREKDVLRGLVAGKTNKMIARDLGISARTVEEYRATARTKLGVRSLSGLVQVALRAGL